jgi:hypothetical protein
MDLVMQFLETIFLSENALIIYQYIISIPLCLFMIIKIIDMFIFSILWDLRYGKKYSNDFHNYLKKYGAKKAIIKIGEYGHNPMRISKAISQIKPKVVFQFLSDIIYRWPSLTLLCAVLLLVVDINWLKWLIISLVLLSIISEFIHQLVSRLILGVADNINKYAYIRLSKVGAPETLQWHTSKILKDTVITILIQLFVFILSYACIYNSLDKIDPNYFLPPDKYLSILDSIYFSLVTVTSVGFGDITPIKTLSKWLVISNIVVVWTIIVLVVFHYGVSLTTRFEENS